MVSKWVISPTYKWNIIWGYNPLLLTFDPNFLGHPRLGANLINSRLGQAMTHSGGMDFPASKPPRESNRHCRPAIFGPCVDVVFQEEMDFVFSIARFSRNYTPTKPEALFVKVCHLTKVQEKNL